MATELVDWFAGLNPARRKPMRVFLRPTKTAVVLGLLGKGGRTRGRVEYSYAPDPAGRWAPVGVDFDAEAIGATLASDGEAATFAWLGSVVGSLLDAAGATAVDDPVVALLVDWVPWLVSAGKRRAAGKKGPMGDPPAVVVDLILRVPVLRDAAIHDRNTPTSVILPIAKAAVARKTVKLAAAEAGVLLTRREIPIDQAEAFAFDAMADDVARFLDYRPDASAAFLEQAKALAAHTKDPVLAASIAAHPNTPEAVAEAMAALAVSKGRAEQLVSRVCVHPASHEASTDPNWQFTAHVTPTRWANVVRITARAGGFQNGFIGIDAPAAAVAALGFPGSGVAAAVDAAEQDHQVAAAVRVAVAALTDGALRDMDRGTGACRREVVRFAVEVTGRATCSVPVCAAILDEEVIRREVLGAAHVWPPGAARLAHQLAEQRAWNDTWHQRVLAEQIAGRGNVGLVGVPQLGQVRFDDAEAVGIVLGAGGDSYDDQWRGSVIHGVKPGNAGSVISDDGYLDAAEDVVGRAEQTPEPIGRLRLAALAVRLCQASAVVAARNWTDPRAPERGDTKRRDALRQRAHRSAQKATARLGADWGNEVHRGARWVLATPMNTMLDLPIAVQTLDPEPAWMNESSLRSLPVAAMNVEGVFRYYIEPAGKGLRRYV